MSQTPGQPTMSYRIGELPARRDALASRPLPSASYAPCVTVHLDCPGSVLAHVHSHAFAAVGLVPGVGVPGCERELDAERGRGHETADASSRTKRSADGVV